MKTPEELVREAVTEEQFTIAMLAKHWHVNERTVRKWIFAGTLRARRIGPRCVRITATEVARFEAAQHIE